MIADRVSYRPVETAGPKTHDVADHCRSVGRVKILVAGATGQVGFAITEAVAAAGHEVTVLARSVRTAFPAGVHVVAESSFSRATFERVLSGTDSVIYAIGLPEQFTFDSSVFERVNHGLLSTFLAAAQASALRRLVYVSTYEVFQAVDGRIRESHPVADPEGLSPYFAAMTRAYRDVTAFAERTDVRLTTVHPAALYGGLNTGDGFTGAVENLLGRRWWRLPVVPPGRFPLVHAESLAAGVLRSLDVEPGGRDGPFIISDGMVDLRTLARTLRAQAPSYVPPQVPAALAYAATVPIEGLGRLVRRRPILAEVQLDFITSGAEPLADRARAELGWTPMPFAEGLSRYVLDRERLLAARA